MWECKIGEHMKMTIKRGLTDFWMQNTHGNTTQTVTPFQDQDKGNPEFDKPKKFCEFITN